MHTKILLASALSASIAAAPVYALDKRDFTTDFPLQECSFITDAGQNPYFILDVGRVATLDNSTCYNAGECDEYETATITVTGQTRTVTVDGQDIITRVITEEEFVDGDLLEISHNYYAECAGTRDVYYFGEAVDIFENCDLKDPDNPLPEGCVTHDGEWEAGIAGARPGLIMAGGAFLVGARYAQEIAPGVAMDRSEHIALGLEITVPAGTFQDCVEVLDTTAFDNNKHAGDTKYYCPGTGIVVDNDIELVSVIE